MRLLQGKERAIGREKEGVRMQVKNKQRDCCGIVYLKSPCICIIGLSILTIVCRIYFGQKWLIWILASCLNKGMWFLSLIRLQQIKAKQKWVILRDSILHGLYFKSCISSAFLVFFISAVLSFTHPCFSVDHPGLANWEQFSSTSLMYFFRSLSLARVFLAAKSIQVFRRPLVAYSFRGSFLWSLACETRRIHRRSGK